MARKGIIFVDQALCKGCFLCERACPVGVLGKGSAINALGNYPINVMHAEKCIACGNCYTVCPDVCIEVRYA
ncbi:MAG: 4Fe-4S binding protein [Treponema sp.]|jgi:2-oxoglutarate ferredoxin oxidoreductase subunit delta|nr:4Fe-4S binding protein [Treponema sp.]